MASQWGKDDVLAKLDALNIGYMAHEHAPVMTCDAMTSELLNAEGDVVKNLLIKDKKNRLYLITALHETKIKLPSIGARLGVGKSVRMAPGEMVSTYLGVDPGAVTPLCVVNKSAERVTLLLDQNIRESQAILVHPLVNTSTVSISPDGLVRFLEDAGRAPLNWVDLEAEAIITADKEPDLKAISDATLSVEAVAAAPTGGAPGSTGPAAAAPAAKAADKKAKKGAKAVVEPPRPPPRGDDVPAAAGELEKLFAAGLPSMALREEVEAVLGRVKNAAYAAGFATGRKSQ